MYILHINNKPPTFAVGSAVLIARKAAEDAVPPPINKYGTLFGMSFDSSGNLIIFRDLSVKKMSLVSTFSRMQNKCKKLET
jgi:hypothetical protein